MMTIEEKYLKEDVLINFTALVSINTSKAYQTFINTFFHHFGLRDEARLYESFVEFIKLTPNSSTQVSKKSALIKYFGEIDEVISAKLMKYRTVKGLTKNRKLSFDNEKLSVIIKLSTYGSIIEFIASTGLRISEALNVKFSDIDENGEFNIIGKGNKERRVFLPAHHAQILARIRHQCGLNSKTIYVMEKLRGGGDLPHIIDYNLHKVRVSRWSRAIKEEFLKFGVRNVRMHDLRSNYICTLADKGAKVHTIANIVGHSNVITTSRYLNKEQEEVARRTASLFSI